MSHFHKRHYQAIAQVMQDMHPTRNGTDYDQSELLQWQVTCDHFVDLLAHDNPLFKADLFLQACKPGSNVRARKVTASGSVECPHCHWGFAPHVIDQHIREKH